jgi:hypothetical protein
VGFLIAAALAPAEDSTWSSALVAFAVLLKTLGLLALAAFADFIGLHSQTEAHLILRDVLAVVLLFEPMSVAGQCLDDCLLVLLLVVVGVAAGLAVAVRGAELLFLEALAVKFETSAAFAATAELAGHFLLLVDHGQNDVVRTFGVTAF